MPRFISHRSQVIRSYYGGIGKLSIIFPSAFFTSLGIGLVNLGLIFFARDIIGLSPSRVGLLAAVCPVFYTLSCLFIRPVFDRILPRYLIIGSSLFMFISIFGIRPGTPTPLVFVLCGFYGAAMGLFWSPMMAWLSLESEGQQLGRLLSLFNLSWGVGGVISPFACGLLYELSPSLPLRTGSMLFLMVSVFVSIAALSLPGIKNDLKSGGGPPGVSSIDSSTPLRYPSWIGLWVSYFGIGILMSVFPLVARKVLGLPETSVGLLLLCYSLFTIIGFFILGRTVFWQFRPSPMMVSLIIRSLSFWLIIWTRSPLAIAFLMALFGLTSSLSYSASIFHGSSGSLNRSRRMAIHESVLAAGAVCGSLLGGLIYEYVSVAALFRFASFVTLAGVMAQTAFSLKFSRFRKKWPQPVVSPVTIENRFPEQRNVNM